MIEVSPPITELVTPDVFNNSSASTAALISIYSQMADNTELYFLALNLGLSADELENFSTSLPLVQAYTNALQAVQAPGPWSNAYNYIYRANAIIEGLKSTKGVSEKVSSQLIGEAKFLRAFWYFYLANIYGDVPLVVTSDYSINARMPRASAKTIFAQINSDLNDAIATLNNNYVDISDTVTTLDRVRPNKWAARALLARSYLFEGEFDSAANMASLVIGNSAFFTVTQDLDSVFLVNSPEAIWQLQMPQPSSYDTYEGAYFILLGEPSTNYYNCTALSPQLMGTFESGDHRKIQWVDSVQTGSTTYFFPFKYKVYQTQGDIIERSTPLRLAEQYLIRAECRAQSGDVADAITDLNVIRSRAGLPNYSGLQDKNSLLQAILHERQVELFSECGHRWFDLKRTGSINNVMGEPGGVCSSKGGTWNLNKALYPVPQSDLSNDPNLTQNPGY
ncbi:MAG: hypothetical protein BGO55_08620 [Sphingobacteriales bacterium 50-39]|nr:RagB/SusD family nutrient uptake outer membrane protein [Sphingobacteriales bacterium]OJW59327.1 MAG: hypothetical protein BGO55_08620 [Sphingobacteriales bacterium 50-39]